VRAANPATVISRVAKAKAAIGAAAPMMPVVAVGADDVVAAARMAAQAVVRTARRTGARAALRAAARARPVAEKPEVAAEVRPSSVR